MSKNELDFSHVEKPFTEYRRTFILDAIRENKKSHTINFLTELDVTEVVNFFRAHQVKTGEILSFTAYMVKCLAQAISENKEMHAVRQKMKKLIMYDDIDVNILIEKKINGEGRPYPYTIRAADKKSFWEIQQEIRSVVENFKIPRFHSLPRFIRKIFWWKYRSSARLRKKTTGTVGLSNWGMKGSVCGWPVTASFFTIFISIGCIMKKPWVVDEQIKIREILHCTLCADHFIIDGIPLAQFATRLRELVESGSELLKK
ncbi:MAG: 2-oxo acid dehydrogenase subunit E2 [Candidatus Helarchaeota archaeon]